MSVWTVNKIFEKKYNEYYYGRNNLISSFVQKYYIVRWCTNNTFVSNVSFFCTKKTFFPSSVISGYDDRSEETNDPDSNDSRFYHLRSFNASDNRTTIRFTDSVKFLVLSFNGPVDR